MEELELVKEDWDSTLLFYLHEESVIHKSQGILEPVTKSHIEKSMYMYKEILNIAKEYAEEDPVHFDGLPDYVESLVESPITLGEFIQKLLYTTNKRKEYVDKYQNI